MAVGRTVTRPAEQRRVERSTRPGADHHRRADRRRTVSRRAAQAAGGFVQHSDTSATGDGHSTASFVLARPAPERPRRRAARLSRLGHVKSLSRAPTTSPTPTTAPPRAWPSPRAQRSPLLRALSKATVAQEISSLRARIADNRRALPRYERQLAAVRNRADYATVGVGGHWRRPPQAGCPLAAARGRGGSPADPRRLRVLQVSAGWPIAALCPRSARARRRGGRLHGRRRVARPRCRPDANIQSRVPRNSSRRGPFKTRARGSGPPEPLGTSPCSLSSAAKFAKSRGHRRSRCNGRRPAAPVSTAVVLEGRRCCSAIHASRALPRQSLVPRRRSKTLTNATPGSTMDGECQRPAHIATAGRIDGWICASGSPPPGRSCWSTGWPGPRGASTPRTDAGLVHRASSLPTLLGAHDRVTSATSASRATAPPKAGDLARRLVGTMIFMAPEQICGEPVDPRRAASRARMRCTLC